MLLLLLACGRPPAAEFANVAPARVAEVQPCGERVAVRVQEADWDFWASIPKMSVAEGEYLLLGQGEKLPRLDCEGRRLDEVLSIDSARVVDRASAEGAVRLEPPPGGLAIAELTQRRMELAGQTVRVRGRVVKINRGIFGKNWLHLSDGTLAEGDLTVTSDADAEIGDVVVAEGPVSVDRDFGFGYFYAVILEGAVVRVGVRSP